MDNLKGLNCDQLEGVDCAVSSIFEDFSYKLKNGQVYNKDTALAAIWETDIEANVYSLSTRDKVCLVCNWGDLAEITEISCEASNFFTEIENLSSLVVRQLAMEKTHEELAEIHEMMEDEDLTWENWIEDNPNGYFVHFGERDIENSCVYEYRNLEHEIHVDIYEYKTDSGNVFFFQKYLEIDDVAEKENYFNASP